VFAVTDPPTAVPADSSVIVPPYDFRPAGATFSSPVTLTFIFAVGSLPSGIGPADLYIAHWDGTAWQPVPTTVDETSGTVTGKTSVFSRYGVFGRLPPPPPPPTIQPALEPAKFTLSDVTIDPTIASPDQSVTISAKVSNSGGASGDYELTLKVSGVAEATKEVSIAAGGSSPVTFTVTRGTPGSYQVDLNGTPASFTIQEVKPTTSVPATPAVPPPTKSRNKPAVVIGIVIVVLAAVGICIGVLVTRRKAKS